MKKNILILLLFLSCQLSVYSRILSPENSIRRVQFDYYFSTMSIDSIEIKLIDWNIKHNGYYGIDRKAFDQTFEYLKDSNQATLAYAKIHEKSTIELLAFLFDFSINPYPIEAIQLTPNEIQNQSIGFFNNCGIMDGTATNGDPLEIRGKIIIYTNNNCTTDIYLSNFSLDVLNYRFSMGEALYQFIQFINQNYNIQH